MCLRQYHSVFHFSWPGNGKPHKFKDYAPFGQLPVLRDGDLILCESGAICRHLARKCRIDGCTDDERARVDMYFELAKDIKGKKGGLFDDKMKQGLANFLKAAEDACDGRHFVGRSLTLADVAMFEALHGCTEAKPGSLGGYPKLSAFVSYFATMPNVERYLDSARRMPLTPNEVGDKPWSPKGYEFLTPVRRGSYATLWEGP